jgi:hypothetical protein
LWPDSGGWCIAASLHRVTIATHAEGQGKLKKKDLIKPVLDKIRSKCILHYLPSATVAVNDSTVSFRGRLSVRTYNSMKPIRCGLKMFVLSDSTNFKPYMGSTENESLVLLKTTQIVNDLCCAIPTELQDVSTPTGNTHHHSWLMSYWLWTWQQ